jgi:hypothetical protein
LGDRPHAPGGEQVDGAALVGRLDWLLSHSET